MAGAYATAENKPARRKDRPLVTLEQRSNGLPIVYHTSHAPGEVLKPFPLAEAREVTLRCGGHTLIIRDININAAGVFAGILHGIEPLGAHVAGLEEGDVVTFGEKHVFRASNGS